MTTLIEVLLACVVIFLALIVYKKYGGNDGSSNRKGPRK